MRGILLACAVGTICQTAAFHGTAFGQLAAAPSQAASSQAAPSQSTPTQTALTPDGSTQASWITHRHAGQLQWLDPANWEIRGCRTFSAETIRAALAVDIDVTLATHPSAPADNLETLPALLRDKIVTGYQSLGFYRPQVSVTHARDDKKMLIDITEGQRFNCGPIEITGTHELNRDQLAAQLTQPTSGALVGSAKDDSQATNTPVWKTGEPAKFDTVDLAKLRKNVQRALADLGHPIAKFEMKVEPNGTTAQLSLQITDEGPATTVDNVVVLGMLKNSQLQIKDYLGVKKGTVWTRAEKARIENLLLESARFREFKVDYTVSDKGLGTVSVVVVECKSTPPLSQDFSPEQQALLKFGKWLETFEQSTEDLIFTANEGKFSLESIFSPLQGCVVTIRQLSDKQNAATPARHVLLTTDVFGLYSEVRGHQWVAPLLPGYLGSTYEFRIAAEGDESKTTFVWGLGVRTSVATSGKRPAMQLKVKATPSALVSLARQDNVRCTLAGDVLTIEFIRTDNRDEALVRIDAKTGKLLNAVATDEQGGEARLSLAPGAFTQQIKSMQATWGQKSSDFSGKQPLTSLLSFLLDESRSADIEKLELVPPLAINAVRKTVSQGLFQPFDEFLLQSAAKFTPPLFSIPYDYESRPQFVSALSKFSFISWILGNDIAARDTWPWVLTREATAWLTGLDEYQQLELVEQLELPGNGPLCCLVTAELLVLAGQNDAARQFATLGLAQLSPEKFHDDVSDLLDERGLLGRFLLRAADVLRETDSLTIAFIGFTLPEGPQQLLTKSYIELTNDGRPIAQALPAALDKIWDTVIKSNLETALKAVRQRAGSNPAQLANPADTKTSIPTTARSVGESATKKQ